MKYYWTVLRKAGSHWMEDNSPRMGAALAYYTLFSITPLLVLVITLTGLLYEREAVQGELINHIETLAGDKVGVAIQDMLQKAHHPDKGILATVIAVITLFFGATGVFGQLQDALNSIFKVEAKPGKGLITFLRKRLLSFALILGIGFLLIVSLSVSTGLAAVGKHFQSRLPINDGFWLVLNTLVSLCVLSGMFAVMYKFLPDVRLRWRDVLPGALITGVLFELGKLGLGLYLGRSSTVSGFGAAGGLVVLLVWVYYSAQILFFGAEWIKARMDVAGTPLVPEPHAMREPCAATP